MSIRNQAKKIKLLRVLAKIFRLPFAGLPYAALIERNSDAGKYLIIKYLIAFLPQSLLLNLEKIFSFSQGKGLSPLPFVIQDEIYSCLKILKIEPKIIIDIGANIGLYTKHLLIKFPNADYHLFEPSSYNIKILQKSFQNYPNINIHPYALSDKSETGILYSNSPGSPLGSLTKRKLYDLDIEMNFQEKIKEIRFDEFWKSELEQTIDYVKIDAEGYELKILHGFGNYLNKIKLIQFEFGAPHIDTRTFFRDFWVFFKEKNFTLYIITPLGPKKIKKYSNNYESFTVVNFIASNNDFINS